MKHSSCHIAALTTAVTLSLFTGCDGGYGDKDAVPQSASPPSSADSQGKTSRPVDKDEKIEFPSDRLALYIAKTLDLAVGYPLRWKPASSGPKPSEDLLNVYWLSPDAKKDAAAMTVMVVEVRPSESHASRDPLVAAARQQLENLERYGLRSQVPSLIRTEPYQGYHLCTLRGGKRAIVIEARSETGEWPNCVFVLHRSRIYALYFTVRDKYLATYRDDFALAINWFLIGEDIRSWPIP